MSLVTILAAGSYSWACSVGSLSQKLILLLLLRNIWPTSHRNKHWDPKTVPSFSPNHLVASWLHQTSSILEMAMFHTEWKWYILQVWVCLYYSKCLSHTTLQGPIKHLGIPAWDSMCSQRWHITYAFERLFYHSIRLATSEWHEIWKGLYHLSNFVAKFII